MAKKFIVEFGTGIDMHGMDETKAAIKAIKNATSNSTLVGLDEIIHFDQKTHKLFLGITIATPHPDTINIEELKRTISWINDVRIKVVTGGLLEKEVYAGKEGKHAGVVVVNCSITVYVKTL